MSRVGEWWREWWSAALSSILAVVAICALIWVCIIAANGHSGPTDSRFGLTDAPIASRIIMDRVTGVYYLVLQDNGIAVTPLLNVDGLPMCVDDANHGDIEMALSDVRANVQRWEAAE